MDKFRKSVELNNSSTFKVTTLFGQAIGGISLFLGFAFSLLGLSGSLDLVIESNSINARLINASPGVIFIIVGLFIIWRYKPKGSDITIEEHIIHHYDDQPCNDTRLSSKDNQHSSPIKKPVKNMVLPSYSFNITNPTGLPLNREQTQEKQSIPTKKSGKKSPISIGSEKLTMGSEKRILGLDLQKDIIQEPKKGRLISTETYTRRRTSDSAMTSR